MITWDSKYIYMYNESWNQTIDCIICIEVKHAMIHNAHVTILKGCPWIIMHRLLNKLNKTSYIFNMWCQTLHCMMSPTGGSMYCLLTHVSCCKFGLDAPSIWKLLDTIKKNNQVSDTANRTRLFQWFQLTVSDMRLAFYLSHTAQPAWPSGTLNSKL